MELVRVSCGRETPASGGVMALFMMHQVDFSPQPGSAMRRLSNIIGVGVYSTRRGDLRHTDQAERIEVRPG